MKKITLLAIAVMALGLFSCNNNKEAQTDSLTASVEAFGADAAGVIVWSSDAKMVAWDDSFNPVDVTVAEVAADTASCQLALADAAAPQGVRRYIYPASAYAGQGIVTIPVHQECVNGLKDLVYYSEEQEGKVDFKMLGGVVRIVVTTPEKLSCIAISTSDSNLFMAGNFQVVNYPSPVLNAVEGAERQIDIHNLEGIDFTEGAEVSFQVAPGCYSTFQIVLQNTDGKVCTKNLKDDKHIVVDRNRIVNITLGHTAEGLTFE